MSEIAGNSLGIKPDLQNQQVQLSKSDIFGILQNDRRRYVLEILRSKGNQSVRSLSEEIARLESGEDDPKSTLRKSVYVSLLQTHIPKMESLGVINYNRETILWNFSLQPAPLTSTWKPSRRATSPGASSTSV